MALVAYDYSSESENEEESNCNALLEPVSSKTSKDTLKKEAASSNNKSNIPTNTNIFSSLPPTREKQYIEDSDDKIEDFIPKPVKEKQKVRITIPSLSQFSLNEDESPPVKKSKSSKGSGLLGLLPPVKSVPLTTKSFVPNSVKNKNAQKPSVKSLVPDSVKKNPESKKKETLKTVQKKLANAGSDIESDDDLEIPDTFDDEMWEKVCGRSKRKPEILNTHTPEQEPEPMVNIAPEPEAPYDGLDNRAFKELVGNSKRPLGNIKLIDIHEEEILPDKDLWMRKSLTDPDMAPRASEEDQVDPTRRRKHHITYLAQQAKANEQELQSSWASSKNNRMMSRAKYGF